MLNANSGLRAVSAPLAGERLRPLGHVSADAYARNAVGFATPNIHSRRPTTFNVGGTRREHGVTSGGHPGAPFPATRNRASEVVGPWCHMRRSL